MSTLRTHVPELDPRTWNALFLLTATLGRRFLREGLVMRSLVWPAAITIGTLVATLGVVAATKDASIVAISPAVPAEVAADLGAHGWTVRPADDPAALVRDGGAWAGTDGATIWATNGSIDLLELEAVLRAHRGAPWRPSARDALPQAAETEAFGRLLCQVLAVLFALYGVVFGLGSVARDRDDGTLEAELALPVPHWVPGMARWLAATAVLTLFFGLCVALFHAVMGVDAPWAMVRHGFAACGGAAAIGLMVVGAAGLEQGFSGPLAASLAIATGAIGFGLSLPTVGHVLPLASVFAGGSGWGPAGAAIALGLFAAGVFSVRSARS